jgi:alkylation response protein AidB-like acyl-CoA dehydrogenase
VQGEPNAIAPGKRMPSSMSPSIVLGAGGIEAVIGAAGGSRIITAVFQELGREVGGLSRAAGLLSPHGPKEFGGLGLDHRGMAVVFEAAGWSTLGPLALNIQAPDEGNVNLLNVVATPRAEGPLAGTPGARRNSVGVLHD